MKQELIEYHRARAKLYEIRSSKCPPDYDDRSESNMRNAWHLRAVAWLELLPEYSKDYLEALKSVNEREPKVYSK